jgi:CheY-like chemotaxis protein
MPRSRRVWLVDDTARHHDTARATLEGLGWHSFRGFSSGREALRAYAEALAGRGDPPDVVLMDFFLGGERGDQVTRRLRELERSGAHRALVVGYSSMAWGSEAIVAAGGDAVVPKRGGGTNPELEEWLLGLGGPAADGC